MKIELTALILSQAKTFAVMLAAGILTESLWQAKSILQKCMKCCGSGNAWEEIEPKNAGKDIVRALPKKTARPLQFLTEITFWFAAAATLSGFLYYCAYGKLSVHAAAGFFAGLLLWKKILRCGILRI